MTMMSPSYERPTGLPCVECPNDWTCTVVCDTMWAWAYHALTGKEYMDGKFKKICGVCGNAFYPANPWNKYCSEACRKEKRKDYNRKSNQKRKNAARE